MYITRVYTYIISCGLWFSTNHVNKQCGFVKSDSTWSVLYVAYYQCHNLRFPNLCYKFTCSSCGATLYASDLDAKINQQQFVIESKSL